MAQVKVLSEKEVFNGEDLIKLGKEGNISEAFTSKNGEVFTVLQGQICYISKSARQQFSDCKVSDLVVKELNLLNEEGEKSTLLRMQKQGMQLTPKQGNWH